MEGAIETWDKGFGIIRGEDKETYKAHFTDFKEYKKDHKKMIFMEIGQDVSFTPSKESGRGKALDIIYDSRTPLLQFAHFPDYHGAITELASQYAVPEKWSSSTFVEADLLSEIRKTAIDRDWIGEEKRKQESKLVNANKPISINENKAKQRVEQRIQQKIARKKYDVLFSYLERTFERIRLEDKIVYSNDAAAFNTGLGNKFDKDVYAIFRKNIAAYKEPYVFEKFADGNTVGKQFPSIPELPNYFLDISTKERTPSDQLMFDYELRIFPDDQHLFDERRTRFPDAWQEMSDGDCASNFEQLLERTRSRVKRNFRAAVPFYYPALKKIQMLLPITFNSGANDQDIRALVVSREGAGYSVETIMPLEWAYKNARLLAKPDRDDWLDF